VTFGTGSLGRPRTLLIKDPAGRVLLRKRIPPNDARVSFPVSFRRQETLIVTTEPGPRPISETLPTKDPRNVSIFVRQARFIPGGRK